MHMYNVIIFVNEYMRESATADVIFVASWPQNPWKFSQTLHGMVLLVELVKEREL